MSSSFIFQLFLGYELIHLQNHNHHAMFSFRATLPWGASRCGSEASCRCGSWARGVCGFGDPFLRTSHEVNVMVTYSSLFFSKCDEFDSSSMWYKPIHHFKGQVFMALLSSFTSWDLCTCRRMRATIYTIERPLPSSWSMLISVWSLGSPILRDWLYCVLHFFVWVLYDWNTVWKKKVETFEKSFWLSTGWNTFFFQLVVSGPHIVANQLKKFWDGLT